MTISISNTFNPINHLNSSAFDFHEIVDPSKLTYSVRRQMFESINDAFASYREFDPSDNVFTRYDTWDGFISDLESPDKHWLVARKESQIVGGLFFKHTEKKLQDGEPFYFGTLWVDFDARGHGLGSDLVKAAEEKAKDLGYSQVEIYVLEANEKLVHFYSKRGYEKEQKADIYSGSIWNYIKMSKSI